ncbi:hypothetical protein RIF29_10570 [Crotalaria pallida]|uniref:Uncharacterized protein n=1 Tax=Crotalaria pallida TaxID=3830 RepID=A0AAN9FZ14_CROPI
MVECPWILHARFEDGHSRQRSIKNWYNEDYYDLHEVDDSDLHGVEESFVQGTIFGSYEVVDEGLLFENLRNLPTKSDVKLWSSSQASIGSKFDVVRNSVELGREGRIEKLVGGTLQLGGKLGLSIGSKKDDVVDSVMNIEIRDREAKDQEDIWGWCVDSLRCFSTKSAYKYTTMELCNGPSNLDPILLDGLRLV